MLSRSLLLLLLVGPSATAGAGGQDGARSPDVKSAMVSGDFAGAERLARKALLLHPGSPALLTDLGMALQMQGRSTAAIQVFEQALHRGHDARTYALLAEERCKTRDVDGARPMLARVLLEDLDEPAVLGIVAPCYLEMEEPLEAIRVYDSLLLARSFPHDLALTQLSRAYLLAAQVFFQRLVKLPGAEVYRQAIEDARAGRSPDARGAFARATNSPGFPREASFGETVLAWKARPDDPALVYVLSVLSSELSIRQVALCSEEFPNSPFLEQLRLEVLVQQNRDAEAEAGYRELLEAHPEMHDLRYSLGMLYRKQREWDRAAAVFQEAVERDPQEERGVARLSEALEKLERWSEIRTLLDRRVNTADPPLWASLDLAEADVKLGDPRASIQLLKKAEGTHSSSAEVHFRLSRVYRQVGDIASANAEARWLQASFAKTPH